MSEFHKSNLDRESKIVLQIMEKSMEEGLPGSVFKQELLNQIGAKYYHQKSYWKSFLSSWHHFFAYSSKFPALVASIVIIVIGFGITSTYAYISPEVTRNHRLYSLKKALENFQYNLTFTTSSKVDKNLQFASRRQAEVASDFSRQGQIDDETVKEIVANLNQAYNLSKAITDPTQKNQTQTEIQNTSQSIIKQLNQIVSSIENEREKVKVKKNIQNITPPPPTTAPATIFQPKPQTQPVQPQPPACSDECQADEKTCAANAENGFRICGNFDNDTCLEWGKTVFCSKGQICENASCISPCQDECQTGQKKSLTGGYQICGNYDTDTCAEWSNIIKTYSSQPKPPTPSCQNACANAGDRRCADSGYQICGDYDNNTCLEWGETNYCANGSSCLDGVCVSTNRENPPSTPSQSSPTNPPVDCTNECSTESDRVCTAKNNYQICGNFDEDACLELSAANQCPLDTVCNSGACISPA